jgi:hypothetical protein
LILSILGKISITTAAKRSILARKEIFNRAARKERIRNIKNAEKSLRIGISVSLNLYLIIKTYTEHIIINVGRIKNAEKRNPSLNVNKRLKRRLKRAPIPEPSVTKKVFL